MSIILPTEKVKASKKNPRIMLLYGAPKCGKTTMAAQLEQNLILDIENGSDYVDAMKVKANNWGEVYEIGQTILGFHQPYTDGKWMRNESLPIKPYKYLTLDTATQLESWAEGLAKQLYLASPMAAKKYVNNPDLLPSILMLPGDKEGSYGPGYNWLRIAYFRCFDYLTTLAEHLILIAHVKDNQLVDKNDRVVAAGDLSLTGKIKQITCSRADAIGYIYRNITGAENGRPVSELRVSFYCGTELLSGTRSQHLAGQDFVFSWDKIFIEE